MNRHPVRPLHAGERWHVACADTLTALPELPDQSVDAVICDPPYGISFAGHDWDGTSIRKAAASLTTRRLSEGQAFERWTQIWAGECHRILKPGGHLAAFAAPRMSHRLTSGIENTGMEIRDTLMWLYGQGMPKSRRLPGGQATALKPAYEPVILARKPLTGTVLANLQQYGTGALNTDACHIPQPPPSTRPRGCEGRQHPGNTGRWPANVALSHNARCRPGRCVAGCAVHALDRPAAVGQGPSRFFYCAKATRFERDAGCHQLPAQTLDLFPNARRSPHTSPRAVRNPHPTVKPIELMRWLTRLICPAGGVVLDPFCGSGSTGIATVLEQRRFLGIELDPHHTQVAETRITHWAHQPEPDPDPDPDPERERV